MTNQKVYAIPTHELGKRISKRKIEDTPLIYQNSATKKS